MKILSTVGRSIGSAVSAVAQAVAWLWVGLFNLRRRLLRRALPDYVVIELDQPLTERAPEERWYYDLLPGRTRALSIESLTSTLRVIARDPAVKGIVLLVREPELSLAQAQSLTALFDRFRAWSDDADGSSERPTTAPATSTAQQTPDLRGTEGTTKRIIVHLESMTAPVYVMAAAADYVTAAPLTGWNLFGLRAAPLYLKETLARIGVKFDVVKIAPWKTAADAVSRASMSDEERSQTNWLLDSLFSDIVGAITHGRRLKPEEVTALIDQAPISSARAADAGLYDSIAYEDELPALLGDETRPAKLKRLSAVRHLLLRRVRPRRAKRIGVISLRGAITTGKSRRFPIPLPIAGQNTIGSSTAQQLIRAARKDSSLAAVVLHVDSNGGSALASDLIWRELKLLDAEKPLVVYMGNVAASGGYYIAAPGRAIVAQSATLTGSIGVITAKAVTADLYTKIDVHQEVVQRGAHAGIYRSDQPWADHERRAIEEEINRIYGVFKDRVADGRSLPPDSLDDIANGRVWTGRQAAALGLVDQVGDFTDALKLACHFADIADGANVQTVRIHTEGNRLLSQPAAAAQSLQDLSELAATGPLLRGLAAGDLEELFGRERFWLLADGLPRIV